MQELMFMHVCTHSRATRRAVRELVLVLLWLAWPGVTSGTVIINGTDPTMDYKYYYAIPNVARTDTHAGQNISSTFR